MGGFPAVQACEGTPLGEARRGVGVAVSLLAGHAVGVDASVLLYKLVVGNMPMLRSCRERRYAPVAKALANRMLRLVEHGVTPIVVFDGQARYPAKGGEHAERAGRRAAAEARIAAGSVSAAEEQRVLAAAFAPTWDLVQQALATLHEVGLCAIVAPMEADAQLAFLDRFGFTGYTMSTDNDLIVHGCRRVIFEWDWLKMTGRAFALDSIMVKRGTFTEVFETDSGARCTFPEMLPILRLFAALSGCDYCKFEGIGAVRAIDALRSAPVHARLRARDYPGAARVAVAHVWTNAGRALRVPGSDAGLTLLAAQTIVLNAVDAFEHPPAYSPFAGCAVPLSLAEAVPAHLDLDYGSGAGGLNAAPLHAFVGNARNAEELADRVLDSVGSAFIAQLVPRVVRGGDWTAWVLRSPTLVRGKPHGLPVFGLTPAVLATVATENLKFFLRIRQLPLGSTVEDLRVRTAQQIWHESATLTQLPVATDPDEDASGNLLRSVRLAAGALPEELDGFVPPSFPSEIDKQVRFVAWDAAGGSDDQAAFRRDFPLMREEPILSFFRERKFLRLKAVRIGLFRCRMLRTLDGARLVWASPLNDTATRRTHFVKMTVPASFAQSAYDVVLRLEVEHPNFGVDELPAGLHAFPTVRSIVSSACACKAGQGHCIHVSVVAHVLQQLPRPTASAAAPVPPENSSTAGPCMWKMPGSSSAAAAAAKRVALVQNVTVPLPPSGRAQARHDAAVAARGGRAAFLGSVPERAARALEQQRESGSPSARAARLRDDFLLLVRTGKGPSAFEVTWAAEPLDVHAWMQVLSNGGDGSAEALAARATAACAALANLGAAKRRKLRHATYASASDAALAAGALPADVQARVAAVHGPEVLPTPAPAVSALITSSAHSTSSSGSRHFRPFVQHHPFAPIPAPGTPIVGEAPGSMHEFLCGWCGYVQDAKRHWPTGAAGAGGGDGTGAGAGAAGGGAVADEDRHGVPRCVASLDPRIARRMLRFDRGYVWPEPGASFASANPKSGKGRKRKPAASFDALLAAAAAEEGE